jgi:hypothetical protein
MSENGVKSMKTFAAEHGISRYTVSDVVTLWELPTESMSNGKAKGLPPKTQRTIIRRLGIKAARAVAS